MSLVCLLQRMSYLTQHSRGHSGDAVYGWSAVLLQVGDGRLAPGVLVAQPAGTGAAPAPTAGGQEPDRQPGKQQQRSLGQSGAPQPRDGLPILWPLNVSTSAPLQEARPEPSTNQQSGHKRFEMWLLSFLLVNMQKNGEAVSVHTNWHRR